MENKLSQEKIKELEDLIIYHKALYYQGRPEISDHEYDRIEQELESINKENPILKLVGCTSGNKGKIKHSKKMLSLSKTYDFNELKKWVGDKDTVGVFKVDGVSCSLLYKDKQLIMAKTRGDGSEGEDITSKALWINSIPKVIETSGEVEIRGEIYCTEKNFLYLSDEMIKLEMEPPSSQRNIVAGLISRKESIELSRYLSFMAFDLITEEANFTFEYEKLLYLEKLMFYLPKYMKLKTTKDIEYFIKDSEIFMSEGEYQIDGLVISYNDLSLHSTLGETAHHPRYKIAFKFKGESKVATLTNIEWSVSRNGNLTPVAHIDPIELSGAMISRVTLHNYGIVKRFNLKKEDQIEIIRSGEVIPKFLSVTKSSDNDLIFPEECPSCGQKIKIEEIRLVCENLDCPSRIKESILNFIKKIGIDDISSKRLDEFIKAGLVKGIADVYRITHAELLTLNKVKEKLALKLIDSINESKATDLVTFLSALGITGGAYNTCEKVVMSGYNTIEKIFILTKEDLIKIDGFAEKSSEDFASSLSTKQNVINELIEVGFVFESVGHSDSKLNGKTLCITGTLSQKRSVIETKIRQEGGSVVSSVTKKTSYLLCNDSTSNSSKVRKAKELGIPIISESELLSL
jgi:DNA ligase (NAD+)